MDFLNWLQHQNWTEIGVIGSLIYWTGNRLRNSLRSFIADEFESHRDKMKEEFYPRGIAEERHTSYERRFGVLESHSHTHHTT